VGSWIGEIIGSGVGKAIGEAATPFTNAWVKTKESATASHTIDKQTDRDITIAAYQADTQLGLAQRLLDDADRTHWSTRWIRPAFTALSFAWIALELWFWMKGQRPPIDLDPVVKYLLAGIVGSLFLLRPYEKSKRSDIVASVVAPKPAVLGNLFGKAAAK
jgi:hypothetical protein